MSKARWKTATVEKRLPIAKPAPYEDLRDPALGNTVPRCLTCGMPKDLVTGTFIPDRGNKYAGRRFRYRLCVTCISRVNGPQDPDPLTVDEAA